jgi:hypothetical protein
VRRIFSLPYTFVLMNLAALEGLFHFISGKKDVWSKSKSSHRHKH